MSQAALPADCPGCGTPRLASAGAVCDVCSTPWEAAQRRLVTVLFADLAGYTSLCQARDPEEVHLLVRPLMNSLRRVCEDYGGVVPSIEGDGFMAAFGAKLAAEDDPQRAIWAAVQLQRMVADRRRLLPGFPALRVGLHAGEVVVAPSWEVGGVALSGDVVNVASRLSGAASHGEVLVSAAVLDLAGVPGIASELRDVELRGRDEPVSAALIDWAATTTGGQSPRWSSVSRYVPRPVLEETVRQHLEQEGCVLVVGDAGSGKSRLVTAVTEGRDLLRVSCMGLVSDFRTTLAGLLRQSGSRREELLDALAHASGTETDDLISLCEAASRALPIEMPVIVDDAEVLNETDALCLAAAMRASATPWLVTSRRQFQTSVPVVEVPALLPVEAEQMVDGLLPGATPELLGALIRRAGDSPLFLEQCARLLLESGAVSTDSVGSHVVDSSALREIPSSMRLFVSGRLDLLSGRARELLGIASVLGDAPDRDLLLHLGGRDAEALQELVDRRFLQWVDGASRPSLRFSHALVRDVAYETLLRTRRSDIHRAAAEWYAVLPVSEVLEQQAYHLEAAIDLSDSDCEEVRRAVDAMVLYARSIEEERTHISRDVLRRARSIVERRPECSFDLLPLELTRASVEQRVGAEEQAEAAARRALDLAGHANDIKAQAEASLVLGRVLAADGDRDPEPDLDRARELFGVLGDVAGLARVEVERGFAAQHRAGVQQQLVHMERAYHLAMRSGDVRLQAASCQQLALHHAIVNGRQEFTLWADRARQTSRRDDVGLAGRLSLSESCLAMFGLEAPAGLEHARNAVVAGREIGLIDLVRNALVTRLELLVMHGDLSEAEALLPECHELSSRRPSTWARRMFDLSEARLRARQGSASAAASLLQGVAADPLSEQLVLRRDLAETRGWVALEAGRFDEAREQAKIAVLIDQESGERVPALRARFVYLVAASALRQNAPLADVAALKADARASELLTVSELASRWMLVEELTHGWTVSTYGLSASEVIEAQALDLEIEALSEKRWDLLLEAAEVWQRLGYTIWWARALMWHAELTGTEHEEIAEILAALDAPRGIETQLRGQVTHLRD